MSQVMHSLEVMNVFETEVHCRRLLLLQHNGHFLIRGGNQVEFEESGYERTVVVEFNSFEDALNCYKSSEYQSALKFAKNSSKRYVSIVKGV